VKFFNPATLLSLLLTFVGGCATQNDVQRAQQGNDTLRTQIANLNNTILTVRGEIAQVRGEVETVRHRIGRVSREKQSVSPEVEALQRRIVKLEQRLAPPRPRPPYLVPAPLPPGEIFEPAAPPDATSTDPSRVPVEALREREEYAAALQLLRQEDYDRAVQQFRNFQRSHPTSEVADDAQYWIGESYFIQKDYNRAILELNDVLKYRRGDKRPDALVRQAEAFLEIGDRTDARLILRKVINDYPRSDVIPKAKTLLQGLEQ
jgi:tol-pal system protein YbgF